MIVQCQIHIRIEHTYFFNCVGIVAKSKTKQCTHKEWDEQVTRV